MFRPPTINYARRKFGCLVDLGSAATLGIRHLAQAPVAASPECQTLVAADSHCLHACNVDLNGLALRSGVNVNAINIQR